jgi:hypothetical protein
MKYFISLLFVSVKTKYKVRAGKVHHPIAESLFQKEYTKGFSAVYVKEKAKDQIAMDIFIIRKIPHAFDFLFK